MEQTVYGIHNNNNVIFLTLHAAEDYIAEQYPELTCGKDSFIELCENMIWEETKEYLMKEVA